MDIGGRTIQRPVQHVTWTPTITKKHRYKHPMEKEIFDQPRNPAKSIIVE
jgi:glucosamine 6-phosphate synthetase-like amidotransferase/phosphosugar isomerase protein